MTREDVIRLAFVDHAATGEVGPADFDAKLDWWNRGWIELRVAAPVQWDVTPLGRVVLSTSALGAEPIGPKPADDVDSRL